MATETVTVSLDGDGSRFVALTGSGHSIVMDNADGDSGPRPAELLVVAQAGCTAMDVASILRKKRQAFTRYEVRVAAEQRDDPPPHVFERVRIVHVVDGPVEIEAVRRAIELSATKYCTVTGNLASGVAEIHHAYLVHGTDGEEHYGESGRHGSRRKPRCPGPANGRPKRLRFAHSDTRSARPDPGFARTPMQSGRTSRLAAVTPRP